MWKYLSEVLISVVAVLGPILLLLTKQHYKLKNIDHALNNVEIDLVDGEKPGDAPSIRQKLNDISKQLETSINKIEEDRRLDRTESVQQRQAILGRIEDIQSDIKEVKEMTTRNTKDICDTKNSLSKHMEEEQALLAQIVDGKIETNILTSRVQNMKIDHQDMV